MENQHRLINGYRELNETEIALMNECKEIGLRLQELVDRVNSFVVNNLDGGAGTNENPLRSVAIARTDLQTGMMWLTRAVAKPKGF